MSNMATSSLLKTYAAGLAKADLVHLLKRTLYGATPADIAYFEKKELDSIISELVSAPAGETPPPLNYYNSATYTDPQGIEAGKTWVNAAYGDGTVNGYRANSLRRWWIQRLLLQGRSIREKLMVFWHNHFVTEIRETGDARYSYRYVELLRKHALGNFKVFVKEMTLNPAMLIYLNGDKNTKAAPDENYGRELQELFCIGKGPGSGYTEDDVKAAARVLTGFRASRTDIAGYFVASRHDTADKTFSSFYKNTVIKGKTGDGGAKELDELLEILFSTEELSRFIIRRLCVFFVHHDINEQVEKEVIGPLARLFRESNYEIKPVLQALFKSAYFFDKTYYGAQIKSPLDIVVGTLREFDVVFPPETTHLVPLYNLLNDLYNVCNSAQQAIGDPPDVAGWKAFYQAPGFYQNWVTSDTYPKRNSFLDTLLNKGYTRNQTRIGVDFPAFARQLAHPGDPNLLITESLELLYCVALSAEQKTQIKTDILLSGQTSDHYWTDLWNRYILNPADAEAQKMVTDKLRSLYRHLLSLPEFQLM